MAGKRQSNMSEVNRKTRAIKAARSQESTPQLELRKTKQAQRKTKTSKSSDNQPKLHAEYLASQREINELAKWRANSKKGGVVTNECPSTMDTTCNYIGCDNTFKDSVMFRYPVDDWKRLNLWLLHSGNLTFTTTAEFRNKYICFNHFPPSELKNIFGATSLVKGAVPCHYLKSGAYLDEEQNSFQVNKSTKVYSKTKTYVLKNYAKKGDVTQMDTKFNGTNLNMLLNQVTHKENQKEIVSVYTIDANGMLTGSEINNKNTDKQTFAIPEDSTEVIVKKEIGEEESNVDETDNDQELATAIKIEPSTDLQIKIEPPDEVDIKLENDSDVKVELEMNPEINEEIMSFEKVGIKVEPLADAAHVQKETNAISNVVVDIKSEWNECSDPEVECGETGVECGDPGVNTSNVLNTEAQGVELRNNADDKQNKLDIKSEWNECSDPEVECGETGVECGDPGVNTSNVLNTEVQGVELRNNADDKQNKPSKNAKRIYTVPNVPKQRGQKPFKCDLCSNRFKYEFMMIAHKKVHGGTDYRCDLCNRECKTKRGLEKHLNSHTKERVFACPTCGQTFTERSRLLNHLIKHSPDETLPCSSCEMSFKSAAELKVHSSVHRTYFSCKVCGAEFPEESGLDEHMKVHTKSLECSFCLKQFRDVGDLQRHTDMHQDMLKKVPGL
ncbi:uncharacterized protein isoform X2 [Choristoneura fumiferana]|uniref:uncharacterized protein isoform X2 n=1 Tax=Choristoneura fumiferana TaxID=7141 RepID=UPI003D15A6A2